MMDAQVRMAMKALLDAIGKEAGDAELVKGARVLTDYGITRLDRFFDDVHRIADALEEKNS